MPYILPLPPNKQRILRIFSILALSLALTPAAAAQTLLSAGDISAWEYHTIDGLPETLYRTRFDPELGQMVLTAQSDQGASAYMLRTPLDFAAHPCLTLNWQVEHAAQGFDERQKSGDDFPLRLIFTAKSGLRYRSLTLARTQSAPGSTWKSPYRSMIHDVRIYSLAGPDTPPGWQRTQINLARLWREQFGETAPLRADAISLMTDSDDSKTRMRARYGDIVLGECNGSEAAE